MLFHPPTRSVHPSGRRSISRHDMCNARDMCLRLPALGRRASRRQQIKTHQLEHLHPPINLPLSPNFSHSQSLRFQQSHPPSRRRDAIAHRRTYVQRESCGGSTNPAAKLLQFRKAAPSFFCLTCTTAASKPDTTLALAASAQEKSFRAAELTLPHLLGALQQVRPAWPWT